MMTPQSFSKQFDARVAKGMFDLETFRAGIEANSPNKKWGPSQGQSFYRPFEKLVNCPKCRGYNLERQWCDLCDGKGYVKDKP